jgi:hypothetical protein
MAKYKTQNDIPYLKFMEYAEVIKDKHNDLEFVAEKIIEFFYPEETEHFALRVEEFSIALSKTKKSFIPYFLCLNKLNRADHFVNAEKFRNDKDFEMLLQTILKPLYWFGKVDATKINLAQGNKIMQSFLTELPRLSNPLSTFSIHQLRLQLKR